MSINECLDYSPQMDIVQGFVDLGDERRSNLVASQVLVFMIRGATKKWKQIIGYFLTKNSLSWHTLNHLLHSGLRFCNEAGLKVIAIVCDQETSQVRLWRELGISPTRPFIIDPAHGHKISIIPDPPHLLKNLRNNLMKYDIQVCMTSGFPSYYAVGSPA